MECYPLDIESKLGFDVVRRSLETRLQTSVGVKASRNEKPSSEPVEINEKLTSVAEWQEALQSGHAPGLSGLPEMDDTLRSIQPEGSWLEPDVLLEVVSFLSLSRVVARFFLEHAEQYPSLAALSGRIHVDAALEKRLSRIVDEQGQVRDDASPDLRRLRKQIRNAEASIRDAAARALTAARKAGYDAGEAPTLRGGRMVIPVKVEGRRKLPGAIIDTSTTGKTAFLEPEECLDLGNELRLLEAQERREIVRILVDVTSAVREVVEPLRQNQHLLATFDCLRAKAHLANELAAVVPEIGDGTRIHLERALNPTLVLLRKAFRSEDGDDRPVVPLSLTLEAPDKTLVVSGPNAGGKSVAMKTIGVLALMRAYGIPIPCRDGAILPMFDRIMVVLGDDQSMEDDLSTFSSHLESLKSVVERSGPNTLTLIDEIGTGTDPAAGEAIARAVLEHLSTRGGFTIATTHFGGLKALANDTPGMINGAMRFDPDRLEPDFVFELGIPGSSYALEIAERADFPRPLLEKAQQHFGADRSRIEDLILELSKSKQEAERKSADLSDRLARAEAAERRHKEMTARLDRERDAMLEEAHERAERLVKEANRTIEQTIREIKEAGAEKTRTKEAREKIERFQRTLDERRPKPARPVARKSNDVRSPEPGDSVVMDDGSAVGEVLRIEGDHAIVAFELGQMNVERGRLRVVEPQRKAKSSVRYSIESSLEMKSRLDVRGFRVAEAVAAAERYIDEAVRVGAQRVEILHGTGTGALRTALRERLEAMHEVLRIEEAPLDQGGPGVTYVFLS